MEREIILNEYLKNLIAKKDCVKPEEVTLQYIHNQREKRIYPNTRYDCPIGLKSFTRNELEQLEEAVDNYMKIVCTE